MRRSDKEINDNETIEYILDEALICRIGLCDNNKPYIVPMNFAYKDNSLYLHSAMEGRKIEILRENNDVCFELDIQNELLESEMACDWGMKYYSVIGFGKGYFIEDDQEKKHILDIFMKKYARNSLKKFEYSSNALQKTLIIKVEIEEVTGKKSGY